MMYKKYHIDRNEEIDAIIELIENRNYYKENSDNGISILINGKWGSGKTTFISDLIKNEKFSKNYKILTYDSFEYDFYENPFIPIFSFIRDQLKVEIDVDKLTRITSKQTGKLLLNTSYTVVNTLFSLKTGKTLDDFKEQMEKVKENFDKENSAYEDFKTLQDIKKSTKDILKKTAHKKPIVFIIDELDRCNPEFAIKTLEIIKYFLDIENFIILLSLDEEQLQESVKTIYGQGINSDIYFSKFFDYKFNLSSITFKQIIDQSSIKNIPETMESVYHIVNDLNISVRDSHKILIEFLHKYDLYNQEKVVWTKYQCVFILFMITLKNIDLLFYNSIMNKSFDTYYNYLNRTDDIYKKKYLKALSWSLFDKSSLETSIKYLNKYADEEYIELKYLYYEDPFDDEMKKKKDILTTMSLFIPQVKIGLTYIENLEDILNR